MIERIKLEDIPNHPWMQNDIDNPDKDPIAGSNESGLPIPSRVPPAHHQQTLNSVGSSNSRSELQQRYSMILDERSLKNQLVVRNLYQFSTTLGLDPVSSFPSKIIKY